MQRRALAATLVCIASIGACKPSGPASETGAPPIDTDTDVVDTARDTGAQPGPPWTLRVEGFGFFNNLGAPVRAVLANDEFIEIARAERTIENGNWTITWPDVLDPDGEGYWLAVWVDNSGNEVCGPNDVAYTLDVRDSVTDRTVLVPFQQSIDFDACIGWL